VDPHQQYLMYIMLIYIFTNFVCSSSLNSFMPAYLYMLHVHLHLYLQLPHGLCTLCWRTSVFNL
jgi:hypothetical protein